MILYLLFLEGEAAGFYSGNKENSANRNQESQEPSTFWVKKCRAKDR